jgi:hypothetical protein
MERYIRAFKLLSVCDLKTQLETSKAATRPSGSVNVSKFLEAAQFAYLLHWARKEQERLHRKTKSPAQTNLAGLSGPKPKGLSKQRSAAYAKSATSRQTSSQRRGARRIGGSQSNVVTTSARE